MNNYAVIVFDRETQSYHVVWFSTVSEAVEHWREFNKSTEAQGAEAFVAFCPPAIKTINGEIQQFGDGGLAGVPS